MLEKVFWNELALPTRKTLAQVMYALRYDDRDDQFLLDSVTREDVLFDADEIYDATLDALEVQFSQMDRKMAIMQRVMNNVSPTLQVLNYQITPPFKRQGTVQIAVIFELSDLQTITIFFHNPDADPKKLAPTDTLLSWKWLLNKKDVTIVVAPEKGKDLNVREVGRRIMKLADKNSAAFAKANARKEERAKQIAEMQEANAEKVRQIEALEKELNDLNTEISGLRDQVSRAKNTLATVQKDAEAKKVAAASQATKNKNWMDDHFVFVGAGSDQVKKAVETKLGITEIQYKKTGYNYLEPSSKNSDQNVVTEPSDTQEPPKAKNAEELKELLVESLNQKKDIHNAFRREDVDGPIDILYRYVKDKKNGNPGRVSGVEHIIESRTADGTLNHVTVEQLFSDIAKAIELGEKHIQAKRPDYERIKLSYGEAEAVLVKDGAMNAYVLTGWNISKEKLAELEKLLPGERGAAHFNPPPTHDDPTISRIKVGADNGNSNTVDTERQGIEETEPPKAKNAEELTNLLIEAIDQKKDIPNAFKREDMDGSIDIDYGNKKMGLVHILLRRKEDGTLSVLSEQEIMNRIAVTLEKGIKEPDAQYGTTTQIKISYGNTAVALVKNPAIKKNNESRRNAWVITGWFISKEELARLKEIPNDQRRDAYFNGEGAENAVSGEHGSAVLTAMPTHEDPTLRRINVGAEGDLSDSNTVDTEKQEAISYC